MATASPQISGTAERILDAAEALFASKGFEGTSLSEVAEQVQIRTPSLYKHYASKEEIYEAVLARLFEPYFASLEEFLAADWSPRADREAIERVMQHLAEHPNLPRLIQMQALAGGAQLERLLDKFYRPLFRNVERMLPDVREAGDWTPEQLRLLIVGMNNMLIGYFTMASIHREVLGKDPFSSEAIREQVDFLYALARKL